MPGTLGSPRTQIVVCGLRGRFLSLRIFSPQSGLDPLGLGRLSCKRRTSSVLLLAIDKVPGALYGGRVRLSTGSHGGKELRSPGSNPI